MTGGRWLRLALGLALALASGMHGTAQPVGSAPRSGYAFLGPELRELQDAPTPRDALTAGAMIQGLDGLLARFCAS